MDSFFIVGAIVVALQLLLFLGWSKYSALSRGKQVLLMLTICILFSLLRSGITRDYYNIIDELNKGQSFEAQKMTLLMPIINLNQSGHFKLVAVLILSSFILSAAALLDLRHSRFSLLSASLFLYAI
jgi:hypothetical protein